MKDISRLTASTRYLWVIAAVAVMVGAFVLLLSAAFDLVGAVIGALSGATTSELLRIAMIEAVDTILVSTVMYVISIGLLQLFVSKDLHTQLPRWLQVTGVEDLESRLTGMVVTVISVIALSHVLEWHGGWDILAMGLSAAAIIAAIGLFLRSEHKKV
ncbi:MAG: YqhA family protein [Caldilineaceae bacterium]|nr:YqhA family protein [Caldilineaceae bacterium]